MIHSLRHTNITQLLAAVIPLKTVRYRAGHAQTSTTANIYSHVIRTADENEAEVMKEIRVKINIKQLLTILHAEYYNGGRKQLVVLMMHLLFYLSIYFLNVTEIE